MMESFAKTDILGVSVDCVTNREALAALMDYFDQNERKCRLVATVNPEMILAARRDGELAEVFKKASLIVPDGIGVVMASRLNKNKVPERVAGCDLVYALFGEMKDTGYTAYILGAQKAVCRQAKINMEKEFPGLKIVGCHDGYFNSSEEGSILEEIEKLRPDLLLVGLGLGRQEKWIHKNRNLPVNVCIGVGGTIDVMAGVVKRAPVAFQKLGLEWLYRLLKQPSRFFRMLAIPKFMALVILNRL